VNVSWWCSARGQVWDGSWQAYPGVWIFVVIVGALFWRWRVSSAAAAPAWRRLAFPIALVLLELALDWPAGPLGAGYFAWVHALQFLALAMVVPPLLLLGLDRSRVERSLARSEWAARLVARVTQPLLALITFAATMVMTHLPIVVDTLMATQFGAFTLDFLWLGIALQFWWPVIMRLPERPHFPPLLRMLYLFFGTQPHLYIAMWLLSADYPAYGTYELAPRVWNLSAVSDQQIAGGIMLVFGATYVLGVISVVFFQWMGREQA